MRKLLCSMLLIVQTTVCLGMMNDQERYFFAKLMPAVDEVDRIFAGKKGDQVFAINAPVWFKRQAKSAVDALIRAIDSAPGERMRAALKNLKTDGVLSNWSDAENDGWVTHNTTDIKTVSPKQKKAIGNIMTIYSGNAKRVLGSKVARLIEDEYLVLQELAKKIDDLFASSKFGLNADSDTKNKLRAAVDSFIVFCKTYKGLAEEPLKKLIKGELFALWDMATNGTGWLDVERDNWKKWKNEKGKAEAYHAVNNGVARIMALYAKDKNLLTKQLNAIFLIVRDVLVGKARLTEIAQERKDITAGGELRDADLEAIDNKIRPRAEILDNELGAITMNASQAQREVAAAAVNKFIAACKEFKSGVIDSAVINALAEHPIIVSWLKTMAINSWWVNKDFADWKKNNPTDYKRFGKESDDFMRAYSKSKTAMQNVITSVVNKAKGAVADPKKLDAEEKQVLETDVTLLQKLAKWQAPAFKLPDIKTELPPESKTPGIDEPETPGEDIRKEEELGDESGERELRVRRPAIDKFAEALYELAG